MKNYSKISNGGRKEWDVTKGMNEAIKNSNKSAKVKMSYSNGRELGIYTESNLRDLRELKKKIRCRINWFIIQLIDEVKKGKWSTLKYSKEIRQIVTMKQIISGFNVSGVWITFKS